MSRSRWGRTSYALPWASTALWRASRGLRLPSVVPWKAGAAPWRASGGGLKQGAPASRTVGLQTEGAVGVTRLAMELVLKHSAVDGSFVGAEVRYAPAGAQLGALWGVWTAHGVPRSLE